jgi:hypothetical protein
MALPDHALTPRRNQRLFFRVIGYGVGKRGKKRPVLFA